MAYEELSKLEQRVKYPTSLKQFYTELMSFKSRAGTIKTTLNTYKTNMQSDSAWFTQDALDDVDTLIAMATSINEA